MQYPRVVIRFPFFFFFLSVAFTPLTLFARPAMEVVPFVSGGIERGMCVLQIRDGARRPVSTVQGSYLWQSGEGESFQCSGKARLCARILRRLNQLGELSTLESVPSRLRSKRAFFARLSSTTARRRRRAKRTLKRLVRQSGDEEEFVESCRKPLQRKKKGALDRDERVTPQVLGFALLDADTAQPILGYERIGGEQEIAIEDLGNVRAIALAALADANEVASVVFSDLDTGARLRTDSRVPYTLDGEISGVLRERVVDGPMTLSLRATPFSGARGTGRAGEGQALRLRLRVASDGDFGTPTPSPTPTPTPTPSPTPTPTPSQGPTVDAGEDQTIQLPTDSAQFSGEATDPDGGEIVSYRWEQISGPSTAGLQGEDSSTLTASQLREGQYLFQLTVRDDEGESASDRVQLTVRAAQGGGSGYTISGEQRQWHKITLTFDGPSAGERRAINPFADYRLDVTFTHGSEVYVVPGYFAADGDAANSGATSGDKWRVNFTPPSTGVWNFAVSFRTGDKVATKVNPASGTATGFDGLRGTFSVVDSNKEGADFRSKGMLEYVGERYLRFRGSGEYFLKVGAGSPENFLGYAGFDNTFDNGGVQNDLQDGVHHFAPHRDDWRNGDPTWRGGRGKEIIGALNYLAEKGVNTQYVIGMNAYGDGQEVWPWVDYPANNTCSGGECLRFDVSKLDQWAIVFDHMMERGIHLNLFLQEQENDQLLHGGELWHKRRLFYREYIARFGHLLALTWNMGEENTNTEEQQLAYAQFFKTHDPYRRLITIHTFPQDKERVFAPLLGTTVFGGASIQHATGNSGYDVIRDWIRRSGDQGQQWVVAWDEQGGAQEGCRPDPGLSGGDSARRGQTRKHALWGTFLAGGAGMECYFGYGLPHNDLDLEDFRTRDDLWDISRNAVWFLQSHVPFSELEVDNTVCRGDSGCRALTTEAAHLSEHGVTVIQFPSGTAGARIDLSERAEYSVKWFNPRYLGTTPFLQNGTVRTIEGPGEASLGVPPHSVSSDWIALIRRTGYVGGDGAFQEQGGRLIMEFESSNPQGGWTQRTAFTPFTGTSYYEWTGNNNYSRPGDGVVQFPFEISTPGNYELRWRSRICRGSDRTEHNDSWVQFPTGQNISGEQGLNGWTKVYQNQPNTWSWDAKTVDNVGRPVRQYFSAGTHTMEVSGRSNGHCIDRIALYKYDSVYFDGSAFTA
ncbi:DUF5060 domain-containing protein, partial [bacterium]|nr:DUF5060 domain-containing protein [bacterium]